MQVKELLSILTDDSNIYFWYKGELKAWYDDKTSIDPIWKSKEVLNVSAGCFQIDICVK